jgi:hypothetical protein
MRFLDRRIRTIGDLIGALKTQSDTRHIVWFRGQSKAEWKLVPQLARNPAHTQAELALIKGFKQNAVPQLLTRPSSEWEWLFLMQHHRLPTRLLDWTESPLTALFFAVRSNPDADGAIWCLDPIALNHSASISFPFQLELPAFDNDAILDNYLPNTLASEKTSDLSPIAAIGLRSSPRMVAQLGVFTITHRTHSPIEEVGDGKHIWRWIIPSAAKSELGKELAHLRFSELTLFPELDRVAAHAKGILG